MIHRDETNHDLCRDSRLEGIVAVGELRKDSRDLVE